MNRRIRDAQPSAGGLVVRVMSRDEVDIAVDWAAGEGWNPGLADAECFHAADADGFLVATVAGEPAATIAAVAYGDTFGFIGCYIVRQGLRGRGYGLAVWQAALARLGDRSIGLDGVVAQQDTYRKSGFCLAHRNLRFGGTVARDAAGGRPPDVVDIRQVPLARILAYDRPLFPAARDAFMTCWLRPDRRVGRALLRQGQLAGYGVIRRCRSGWKVGPLFADDEAAAETLFRALAAECPDQSLFIDLPEPNRSALALAERFALAPVFETARMYRGALPVLPLERIFGITTLELG